MAALKPNIPSLLAKPLVALAFNFSRSKGFFTLHGASDSNAKKANLTVI
jgi:hypothetical protein